MHAIFPEVWELERFPTAKFTSNVTQGYWYWCYSTGLTGYFISLPLQLYLYEYFVPFRIYYLLFTENHVTLNTS